MDIGSASGTTSSHERTDSGRLESSRPQSGLNQRTLRVQFWHGNGLTRGVSFRQFLTRAIGGLLILLTAVVAVGLTAPSDGPFSIGVRPVLLSMDADAIAEHRARALGLDVDIKLGSAHLHVNWSAIPLTPESTKPARSLL